MHVVENVWLIIWCSILHIIMSFAEDIDQADVFKHCLNSTNSTSCSSTFEQVYTSLTKGESNFNISDALYPEGSKPSFLVRVNVFGPNKTSNSKPAKFTWSIHCLYANVPEWLPQILSLGSIFVTFQRQELEIQIPAFCCNISDDKKKRFLRGVLYQQQDLAMLPTIRDPSVNTAESVIQGHEPKFVSTRRSIHIRVIIWLSVMFAICSGLLLAVYMDTLEQESSRKKKNTGKAICFSFYFLSLLSIPIILTAFGFSIYYWVEYKHWDMTIILSLLIFITFLEYFCVPLSWGANPISYIFCWLIIGIRINPAWGLTIALFIISVSAAVTYARYIYLEAFQSNENRELHSVSGRNTTRNNYNGEYDSNKGFFLCLVGCLAVLLLFVIVILVGQANTGQEMAVGELLKAFSSYFIPGLVGWAALKINGPASEKEKKGSRKKTKGRDQGDREISSSRC